MKDAERRIVVDRLYEILTGDESKTLHSMSDVVGLLQKSFPEYKLDAGFVSRALP